MIKESVDEPKADEGLNTNYKADNEKSKVYEDLKLLPHLVHTKLGNALLLQFILSDKDQDDIGLRYWGFVFMLQQWDSSSNLSVKFADSTLRRLNK